MTIQEAIKSGKPFKRKIWKMSWWWVVDVDQVVLDGDGLEVVMFAPNILADDWEVQE